MGKLIKNNEAAVIVTDINNIQIKFKTKYSARQDSLANIIVYGLARKLQDDSFRDQLFKDVVKEYQESLGKKIITQEN